MNVLHMSVFMLYNLYLSLVKAVSSNEPALSPGDEGDNARVVREQL